MTDDDGFVSFGSVRNGSFRHSYWRKPFQAAGYRALFERIPHCLLSERDILARYLKGMGPLLTDSGDEDLANEPLLSIVVSDNRTIFRDYGQFQSWPHAEGQLALNPLYRVVKGDGGVALRREFPSRWYEEENADCRRYLPTEVPISPEVLTDLVQGNVTAEIRGLIDKFVVLGNSFKGRPQMSAQRGDPPL